MENPDLLRQIKTCLGADDWDAAEKHIGRLPAALRNLSPEALATELGELREALHLARSARAGMEESLARIRAAADFERF